MNAGLLPTKRTLAITTLLCFSLIFSPRQGRAQSSDGDVTTQYFPAVERMLVAAYTGNESELRNAQRELNAFSKPANSLGGASSQQLSRGTIALDDERIQEAYKYFQTAFSANPNDSLAATNLAQSELMLGDVNNSLRHSLHAVACDSSNASAWDLLGASYVALDDADRAVASWLLEYRFSRDKARTLSHFHALSGSENPLIKSAAREVQSRATSGTAMVPTQRPYRHGTNPFANAARQALAKASTFSIIPYIPNNTPMRVVTGYSPSQAANRVLSDTERGVAGVGRRESRSGPSSYSAERPEDRRPYVNFLYHLQPGANGAGSDSGPAASFDSSASTERRPSAGRSPDSGESFDDGPNPEQRSSRQRSEQRADFGMSLPELRSAFNTKAHQNYSKLELPLAKLNPSGFNFAYSPAINIEGEKARPSGRVKALTMRLDLSRTGVENVANKKTFISIARCFMATIDSRLSGTQVDQLLATLHLRETGDEFNDASMEAHTERDGIGYHAFTSDNGEELDLVISAD